MKTKIYKFLRSAIASLLFLILIVAIGIQFLFVAFNMENRTLQSLIDRDIILEACLEDDIPEDVRTIASDYLDDYLKYVFHKRSYPSLQTVDYSNVDEDSRSLAMETVADLNESINLEYEDVVSLREANNTLGNKALFLLVNVFVFIIFLASSIVLGDFKKSAFHFAVGLTVSSFVLLVAHKFAIQTLFVHSHQAMKIFLSALFNPNFLQTIGRLSTYYLLLGIVLVTLYVIAKRTRKILT